MSVLRRTATGAVAALAVVISGPALTASAATHHHHYNFKTLASVSGGKLKGCKLHTTDSGPWKVKLRVDASKASSKVAGAAQVTKDGSPASELWRSGWIRPGHRSRIATLTLPRGAGYAVMAGIGTEGMGDGDSFKASDLRRCH